MLSAWQAEDKTSGKTSGCGLLKRHGRSMISSGSSVPIQRALTRRPHYTDDFSVSRAGAKRY